MEEECKHGNIKKYCEECVDERFGTVCKKCKLRKGSFASVGHNLPTLTSICVCK